MALWVVLGEFLLAVALGVFLMVAYTVRTDWWRSVFGRQFAGAISIIVAEAGLLFLVGVHRAPPLWVYAILYGLSDLALARWIWLLFRADHLPVVQTGQHGTTPRDNDQTTRQPPPPAE